MEYHEEERRMRRKWDEYGLPDYMWDGIWNWIWHGHPPGHFLTALLRNDFIGVCNRADTTNIALLREYAMFLYNAAPHGCYGGPPEWDRWIEAGGLAGLSAEGEV